MEDRNEEERLKQALKVAVSYAKKEIKKKIIGWLAGILPYILIVVVIVLAPGLIMGLLGWLFGGGVMELEDMRIETYWYEFVTLAETDLNDNTDYEWVTDDYVLGNTQRTHDFGLYKVTPSHLYYMVKQYYLNYRVNGMYDGLIEGDNTINTLASGVKFGQANEVYYKDEQGLLNGSSGISNIPNGYTALYELRDMDDKLYRGDRDSNPAYYESGNPGDDNTGGIYNANYPGGTYTRETFMGDYIVPWQVLYAIYYMSDYSDPMYDYEQNGLVSDSNIFKEAGIDVETEDVYEILKELNDGGHTEEDKLAFIDRLCSAFPMEAEYQYDFFANPSDIKRTYEFNSSDILSIPHVTRRVELLPLKEGVKDDADDMYESSYYDITSSRYIKAVLTQLPAVVPRRVDYWLGTTEYEFDEDGNIVRVKLETDIEGFVNTLNSLLDDSTDDPNGEIGIGMGLSVEELIDYLKDYEAFPVTVTNTYKKDGKTLSGEYKTMLKDNSVSSFCNRLEYYYTLHKQGVSIFNNPYYGEINMGSDDIIDIKDIDIGTEYKPISGIVNSIIFDKDENVLGGIEATDEDGNTWNVPLLCQRDSRWNLMPYGPIGTIDDSGCGPSSFSMVASYCTGKVVYPSDVVRWQNGNHVTTNSDTMWSLFPAGAEGFGFECEVIGVNKEKMLYHLRQGHPIIACVGNGGNQIFTTGGHFIVLRGCTPDDYILVNDPYDRKNGIKDYYKRLFSADTIINECRRSDGSITCMWAFYPAEGITTSSGMIDEKKESDKK